MLLEWSGVIQALLLTDGVEHVATRHVVEVVLALLVECQAVLAGPTCRLVIVPA